MRSSLPIKSYKKILAQLHQLSIHQYNHLVREVKLFQEVLLRRSIIINDMFLSLLLLKKMKSVFLQQEINLEDVLVIKRKEIIQKVHR
jgi:hypothetical protein